MTTKVPPEIIKNVGFDFSWSEKKVWALNISIEEIDINELTWHFDIPFWNTTRGYYDLNPNQVILNQKLYKEEYNRVMIADLKYPIDIMFNKGKWLILDGLHRLVKAYILGIKNIKVRKIPRSKIPKIEV